MASDDTAGVRVRVLAAPLRRCRAAPGEMAAGLAIAMLLSLGFAAHLTGGLAGLCWRLSCLGYAAICLARGVDWGRAAALSRLWLPFLIACILGVIALPGPAGVADLLRQGFIFGFAGLAYGAGGDNRARRIAAWVLVITAVALLATMLLRAAPIASSGWTYAAARSLKAKSFQGGFNANEVCFAALVALIAVWNEAVLPRWFILAMLALIALCSVLLGARAPVPAMLAAAAFSALVMRMGAWRAFAQHRWRGAVVAALLCGGILALLFSRIDAIAHSAYAPQLAGRAALWQIAWAAWPQQPLFGFGPGTFQSVIHANLGKAHFSTFGEFTTLYTLQAGGFHNIWLSTLVERGAVGLAGLFASWCLLVGFALRYGSALQRAAQFVLLTLLAALFLRGQVELAGLFDDADGPINAIIMLALALSLPPAAAVPRMARRPALHSRDLAARAAAAGQA